MKKRSLSLLTALTGLAGLIALASPALAAPPPPPPPSGGPSDAAPVSGERAERMRKHLRLSRMLGLAEALDLDEAEALRIRGVLARAEERRAPLRKQMREQLAVLRRAARGDAAAQKGVDDALKRLRELRAQRTALADENFQAITQGLTPDRRAKAALFLHRFRGKMMMEAERFRERMHETGGRRGGGPERMEGRGGGMRGPPGGGDRPDLEILVEE